MWTKRKDSITLILAKDWNVDKDIILLLFQCSLYYIFRVKKQLALVRCTCFFLLYRKMRTNSKCSHLHICWNFAVVVNIFKKNTLFIPKLHFRVCKVIICLLEIDYRLNVLKYTITFHNNMTSISLLKSRQIVLNALSNIGIY